MDTSSSALCRIFWLLARHQDIQDKLRAEIREARQNFEEPNYDQLNALPYLDGVIRETLRLYVLVHAGLTNCSLSLHFRYPPGPVMGRECRKDTMLPLSKPIKTVDGTYTQEIFVPKDTMIFASILGSNTNPELWGPDTYEWKPERWFSPVPEKVVEARIPGVYSHL
jgi:cytochrome P450